MEMKTLFKIYLILAIVGAFLIEIINASNCNTTGIGFLFYSLFLILCFIQRIFYDKQ